MIGPALMPLVHVLVALLVLLVLVYVVKLVLDWLGLPHPIDKIVWLIVAIIVLIALFRIFGILV